SGQITRTSSASSSGAANRNIASSAPLAPASLALSERPVQPSTNPSTYVAAAPATAPPRAAASASRRETLLSRLSRQNSHRPSAIGSAPRPSAANRRAYTRNAGPRRQ